MSDKESCAARLPSHLKNRIDSFSDLFRRADDSDDDTSMQAYDEIYEMPLGVSRVEVVKVLLSTGGPGDWFEFHIDRDTSSPSFSHEISRIEYHFQDWFDHAFVVLEDNDFEVAERFGRSFLYE